MQRLSALVCLPPAVAMQAPVQHTMESLARRVEGLEAFVAMESNDTPNYYELRSEVTRIDNRIERSIDAVYGWVSTMIQESGNHTDVRIDLVIADAVAHEQRVGESIRRANACLDSLMAGRAMSAIGKNGDAMAVVVIQKMNDMHEEIAGLRRSLGVQEATIQRQAADIGRQSAEIGILRTRVGA